MPISNALLVETDELSAGGAWAEIRQQNRTHSAAQKRRIGRISIKNSRRQTRLSETDELGNSWYDGTIST